MSAGEYIRFDSNSTALMVNFTLLLPWQQYETIMPADGTSGLDLYAYDKARESWLFVSNCLSAFLAAETHGNTTLSCRLSASPDRAAKDSFRHYMLYMPLYNGVSNVTIG